MHMEHFPSHVEEIERQTLGQSNNPLWFAVCKHAITASTAHAVKTKMASIERAKAQSNFLDMTAIFENISGRGPMLDLPALRYGKAMESEAVAGFLGTIKRAHQGVLASDFGIFICRDRPFIGESPDHIIQCKCCGNSAWK